MKARRVILNLEVMTDVPLSLLKKSFDYYLVVNNADIEVLQAQANVIAAKKDTTIRKR